MTLYYPTSKNFVQKSLNAQLLAGATSSLTLNNVTGIQDKPGVCIIDRIDSNGAETENKREVIVFTGVSGNTLTGLTRNADNSGSDQPHAVGAIVEFSADALWAQKIIDALDGTTADVTLKTPKILTSINDTNGNEVVKTPATASAVNEVTITNSATGNAVQIGATGDDTNIDLKLAPKGTGALLDKNGDALSSKTNMARQAIINGNPDVWQRGTSFTLSTVTAYTADRWLCSVGDANGGLTVSRQTFTVGQTDVPNNPKYFLRFAESSTPGAAPYITQRIEDVALFSSGKATLSVWLKVASGTLAVTPKFVQSFGTGGSPSSDVVTTNSDFTVTTTWTKFTTTFTVPSISGKTLGTTTGTDYCAIKLDFPTGGAFTLDIAQVQLCAGDVALPFQPKSYNDELTDCQRYCWDLFAGNASANLPVAFVVSESTTYFRGYLQYPVTMRTSPTFNAFTASNFSVGYPGSVACTAFALVSGTTTAKGTSIDGSVAAGLTAGRPYHVYRPGTTEKVYLEAEL